MGGFVLRYNSIMATEIYKSEIVTLIDGTELYITPLKLKYLRQFMVKFQGVKESTNEMDTMEALSQCALVTMKQFCPDITTIEDLEDNINLPAIYRILDVSAGIKIDGSNEEDSVQDQATESGSTWDTIDLAKLEAEAFLIGIWKDYEELETSMSMPELMATLTSKRDLDYEEKKFLAAIQGVDLEGGGGEEDPQKKWEDMKARAFSGGKTSNSNDIVALQGYNAQKAGFGIGMGLDYEDLTR